MIEIVKRNIFATYKNPENILFDRDESPLYTKGLYIKFQGNMEDEIKILLEEAEFTEKEKLIIDMFFKNKGKINIMELERQLHGSEQKYNNDRYIAKLDRFVHKTLSKLSGIIYWLYVKDMAEKSLSERACIILKYSMFGWENRRISNLVEITQYGGDLTYERRKAEVELLKRMMFGDE